MINKEDIKDDQWYEIKDETGRILWWSRGDKYKEFLEFAKELEKIEYQLIFGINKL